MHREPFQNQLRRSFIGYVAAILALILLLYLGGFALNFFAVVVRGCRRDNRELETALTQQLAAYDRGAEELTGADALRRAVVRGDRGECLEANRLLYDFTNQQELRISCCSARICRCSAPTSARTTSRSSPRPRLPRALRRA